MNNFQESPFSENSQPCDLRENRKQGIQRIEIDTVLVCLELKNGVGPRENLRTSPILDAFSHPIMINEARHNTARAFFLLSSLIKFPAS